MNTLLPKVSRWGNLPLLGETISYFFINRTQVITYFESISGFYVLQLKNRPKKIPFPVKAEKGTDIFYCLSPVIKGASNQQTIYPKTHTVSYLAVQSTLHSHRTELIHLSANS